LCDDPAVDLYAALAPRVGRVGSGAEIIVDDSKRIFQPRRGLDGLRRGCEALVDAAWQSFRLIDVPEFNRLVAQQGNKAHLLSRASLELAAALLRAHPAQGATLTFDRHGGRRAYGPLLSEVFADVVVVEEGKKISRYGARLGESRLEIAFLTRGDASYLEVALASMRAKLEREMAMKAFNETWRTSFPGLRSTQGYPADAKRFLGELYLRGCDPEELRAIIRER
ncbi:MAG: hypothetical protein HY718_12335, partial [Planctomycetes bacterium]|nr:hypothetical protein [Planctomycetota bacterium]